MLLSYAASGGLEATWIFAQVVMSQLLMAVMQLFWLYRPTQKCSIDCNNCMQNHFLSMSPRCGRPSFLLSPPFTVNRLSRMTDLCALLLVLVSNVSSPCFEICPHLHIFLVFCFELSCRFRHFLNCVDHSKIFDSVIAYKA